MRTYLISWLGLEAFWNALRNLNSRVTRLEKRMSAYDDALEALGEATDNVAAELQSLKDELAQGNLSPEDAASQLAPFVDRLKAMGTQGQVDPNAGTDPVTTTDPANSPAEPDGGVEVVDEVGNDDQATGE